MILKEIDALIHEAMSAKDNKRHGKQRWQH